MKYIRFNHIAVGFFLSLFCSFFIMSCTQDEVIDQLPSQVTVQIDINDPDVQEYLRVRDMFTKRSQALIEREEPLTDNDVLTYSSKFTSIKENLQVKYPHLKLKTLDLAGFLYKMKALFPLETYSRDKAKELQKCIDNCMITLLQDLINCIKNHPPGAARKACEDKARDDFKKCKRQCLIDIFFPPPPVDSPPVTPVDTTDTPPVDTTNTPPIDTTTNTGNPGGL